MIYYHLIKQLNMTAFKEDLRSEMRSGYGSSECMGVAGIGWGKHGSARKRKVGEKRNQETEMHH